MKRCDICIVKYMGGCALREFSSVEGCRFFQRLSFHKIKFPLKYKPIYCFKCGDFIAKYYEEIFLYEKVRNYKRCENCGYFYCSDCFNSNKKICFYCDLDPSWFLKRKEEIKNEM